MYRTLIPFTLIMAFTGCELVNSDDLTLYGHDPKREEADADADADTDADVDTDTSSDTGDGLDTAFDTACEPSTWYRDGDLDGYGNVEVTTSDCFQPDGYVADASDCDDADATVYPKASERCDGKDNDCDGTVDENVSDTWYEDRDRDGFGFGEAIEVICDGNSAALVDNGVDCDDESSAIYPGADEFCNALDDDCDGTVDEPDAIDASAWYIDADSDGYGNSAESAVACEALVGYVADSSDCNDAEASIYPGAEELCNSVDDDCDGLVPDSEVDNDLDGFDECGGGDCNDAEVSIYPGAVEMCNSVDDDCDSVVDESDATDAATWYADVDNDSYGDASASFVSCDSPVGYVADASDCDDAEASANPGESEVCDGLDNDCDGTVDGPYAVDATVWSLDADLDGYGDDTYASYTLSCEQPSGYVADFSDCDDSDPLVNPAATEVYDDSVDNDCDGTVDNSGVYCCVDADLDGYGDGTVCVYEETGTCSLSGYVVDDGDCDDTNPSYYPGAYDAPYPYDEDDADCDGYY